MALPKNRLPNFSLIPEPLLAFHPERREDSHIHPLNGLARFGPYSRGVQLSAPDPIRLAVICPEGRLSAVSKLVQELQAKHQPRERREYLADFKGFSETFGVGLDCPTTTNDPRVFTISWRDLQAAVTSSLPHERLAELLHSVIRRLDTIHALFDVALLYLPETLSAGFRSPIGDELADFDLHDSVKALCSNLRVPLQMLNDASMKYFCRCSVSWRLSLALYAKAGGTPWKLADFDERSAFVGLSYCLRRGTEKKFVSCCSQIFDAQGTNLKFLLYETHDGRYEGRNPYLPRVEMSRVMSRTLDLYQQQKGRPPARMVIHKTTPFTREEIEGCIDSLSSVDDLELLSIEQSSPWRGVRVDSNPATPGKGRPANFPVYRGSVMPIGQFSYLLWTQGSCDLPNGQTFYKEKKGIPQPLVVTRHLGGGDYRQSAAEILGLTKMDWNNDSLYNFMPVTNHYASVLAEIVKRMGSLAPTPYDFRYFM
jgi:hypothetical protein